MSIGHARVPTRHRHEDGFSLGAWVEEQRRKYRAGELLRIWLTD